MSEKQYGKWGTPPPRQEAGDLIDRLNDEHLRMQVRAEPRRRSELLREAATRIAELERERMSRAGEWNTERIAFVTRAERAEAERDDYRDNPSHI